MLDWFAQIDWFAVICWLSAISLIIAGLAGTVIPAIPGLPLIAAGGALIGWGTIATLAVLAVIGVIVDTVAQTAGAQKAGASSYGIWGSVIGTFVGVFMGGLVGIFIMPLVGAFIGEFWAKRDYLHAGRVGVATWVGMVVGTAVKIALAFTMLGLMIVMYFV
jgi:uncharacterized protein YqgC (DUF456 family)